MYGGVNAPPSPTEMGELSLSEQTANTSCSHSLVFPESCPAPQEERRLFWTLTFLLGVWDAGEAPRGEELNGDDGLKVVLLIFCFRNMASVSLKEQK